MVNIDPHNVRELGDIGLSVWLLARVSSLEARLDAIMGGLNIKSPDRKKKWRTPLAVGFIIAAAVIMSGCKLIPVHA